MLWLASHTVHCDWPNTSGMWQKCYTPYFSRSIRSKAYWQLIYLTQLIYWHSSSVLCEFESVHEPLVLIRTYHLVWDFHLCNFTCLQEQLVTHQKYRKMLHWTPFNSIGCCYSYSTVVCVNQWCQWYHCQVFNCQNTQTTCLALMPRESLWMTACAKWINVIYEQAKTHLGINIKRFTHLSEKWQ